MRTIRHAEAGDILPLLQLAEAYYSEATEWDWFELDGDVLYQNMVAAIAVPDHCLLVAYENGKLVGGIWGALLPQVMTRATLARDLFLYVYPEHRDYWTANALVDAFESWARDNGCAAVAVGANSNIRDNRGARTLYRRRGYKGLGEDFIKPIGD